MDKIRFENQGRHGIYLTLKKEGNYLRIRLSTNKEPMDSVDSVKIKEGGSYEVLLPIPQRT
ncbi:hypothetical protein HY989_04150 [Candidatus Micrarchaeota archaeon]|nr:hypothetical protein [Candidatus Micrarchaeota archaeon]